MALRPSPYPETLDPRQRRILGSFYTPSAIVDHLVGATLAPLLAALRRGARAGRLEQALSLRILDPACGDGVFLVAAARYLASPLARDAGLPAEEALRLLAGRCLHGMDVDPAAVRLARRRLASALGAAGDLRVGDALAGNPPYPAASFDVVIGNPPWGGWNRSLTPEARREYRRRFTVARGLLDPAMLFLERSTHWLRGGGRLGLVMPDYFLMKNYPAARAHLLTHHHLEELARWGAAFPGVNLEACTLVAGRLAPGTAGRAPARAVVCYPRGPSGPRLRIPPSVFRRAPGHVLHIGLDAPGRRLLRRLQKRGAPLGALVEAHEGIHSGNVRSRLFLPPAASFPPGGPGGAQRTARPLLFGRDEIRPFVLRPAGWRVVYDPGVVRRDRGEYANLGRAAWYAPPKLLVRRTGDRVVAAVDRQGLMASNNLFVARMRPGCPVPLEYLCAWLNSPLATWCFRALVPRAGALFAELKLAHLARLPVILPPATPAARSVLSGIVRMARRLERADLPDGAPERMRLSRRLDEALMRMAALPEAEAAIIAVCARTAPSTTKGDSSRWRSTASKMS